MGQQDRSGMSWTRKLDAPIQLDDGRTLRTLADVRGLVLSLSERQQADATWQTTGALLLDVAHGARGADLRDLTAQLAKSLKPGRLN
jgi:hypothetical protein